MYPFGTIWTHLDSFWPIWTHLDLFNPFEPLWTHMDPFWPIWSHFDPWDPGFTRCDLSVLFKRANSNLWNIFKIRNSFESLFAVCTNTQLSLFTSPTGKLHFSSCDKLANISSNIYKHLKRSFGAPCWSCDQGGVILALGYRILWYQGSIAIFYSIIFYLEEPPKRIFKKLGILFNRLFRGHQFKEIVQNVSVLDNILLSDIWVICQKCQYGMAENYIYFLDSIEIHVQASMGQIYALLSQNGQCGDYAIFVEFVHFLEI